MTKWSRDVGSIHRDNFLNGNECVGLSGSSIGISLFHLYHRDLSLHHQSRRTHDVFSFVILVISQALVHPPESYFELRWENSGFVGLEQRDVSIFATEIAFFI